VIQKYKAIINHHHLNKGATLMEILASLATGILVGVIFSLFKLPLPAPPVLSGIVGIFGIYAGGLGYQWIIERFFT
jgi:XapX domain-containing protein|tara:strand:+ start:54 stop:281 length:228 start_codon:yes stop_codon:yes gene_type:complete